MGVGISWGGAVGAVQLLLRCYGVVATLVVSVVTVCLVPGVASATTPVSSFSLQAASAAVTGDPNLNLNAASATRVVIR